MTARPADPRDRADTPTRTPDRTPKGTRDGTRPGAWTGVSAAVWALAFAALSTYWAAGGRGAASRP